MATEPLPERIGPEDWAEETEYAATDWPQDQDERPGISPPLLHGGVLNSSGQPNRPIAGQSGKPISGRITVQAADQGPCLYLGPSGQRCDRRAVEGGFCAIHGPGGGIAQRAANPAKVLAAVAAIVALIWP